MLAQGFRAPSEWWKPARWVNFQAQLPDWLREQIALWQRKAIAFDKDLERLDREVEELSRGKTIPKGLGLLTSSLLESEILDWHRFKSRRQVASYTGLCPSEHSSGEKPKQGSISKHGNPRVRHQLVEAVWRFAALAAELSSAQQAPGGGRREIAQAGGRCRGTTIGRGSVAH